MNFVRKNFRKINVAFFVLFLIVTIMLCILQQMADIHYRLFNLSKASQKLILFGFVIYIVNFLRLNYKYERNCNTEKNKGKMIGLSILFALGSCLYYVMNYVGKTYGKIPMSQIMYHLNAPLEGTNMGTFSGAIFLGIFVVILAIVAVYVGYNILNKFKLSKGYFAWMFTLGLMILVYDIAWIERYFEITNYYRFTHEKTTLYEECYVDARDIDLTFPEKKRNLIYIYMESMETSFTSKENGGAMQENYIPELTELAKEGECFAHDGNINGAYTMDGSTYTAAALVSQTAGIPIHPNFISNQTVNDNNAKLDDTFLPGVWNLGDILNAQGYNQKFLIGSDKTFGGRDTYFTSHGNYEIFDYYSAIEEGKIADDYKVWWGYEDKKLFSYAKEELLELAEQDKPFNFTVLTVDTHFTDGYYCEDCGNAFDTQYANVLACSSKKVYEFVRWIQEQDFYDNTTIVLAGDHLTMDEKFMISQNAEKFDRNTYVSIINGDAAVEEVKERKYTTLDLFPTTLAAMGVDIEGERLGLGVNLYSTEETLLEEYGYKKLNEEMQKNSDYYSETLLYAKN